LTHSFLGIQALPIAKSAMSKTAVTYMDLRNGSFAGAKTCPADLSNRLKEQFQYDPVTNWLKATLFFVSY